MEAMPMALSNLNFSVGQKTMSTLYNGLFSSIVADVKSYGGTDPLLPWLCGIRKMKETLPPQVLKDKLPRFLQRCAETFINDRRYANDLRYLRIWLQLMDFVDEPKAILRKMELNHIGTRSSLFYQAYALYYEKQKKFDAAYQIYHLGLQNFAEPADELQKSFDQFFRRKGRHMNKQVGKRNNVISNQDSDREYNETLSTAEAQASLTSNKEPLPERHGKFTYMGTDMDQEQNTNFGNGDTKIVGKHNVEDTKNHDRVESRTNTKAAGNATNGAFHKPLESSVTTRTIGRQQGSGNILDSQLRLFADEKPETGFGLSKDMPHESELLEIYIDGMDTACDKKTILESAQRVQKSSKAVTSSQTSMQELPYYAPFYSSRDLNTKKVSQSGFHEDTVVYRFVGSTISDEPEVENVWHHGLVDPTINMKEAMEDINGMFGKPIEFIRKSRRKQQDTTGDAKNNHGEFLILPDDESDDGKPEDDTNRVLHEKQKHEQSGFVIIPCDEFNKQEQSSSPRSPMGDRNDLFEPTVCTKEALAEINNLFAMPL